MQALVVIVGMIHTDKKAVILAEIDALEVLLSNIKRRLTELVDEESTDDAQGDLFEYARRNSEKQAMESATYRKYLGRVE